LNRKIVRNICFAAIAAVILSAAFFFTEDKSDRAKNAGSEQLSQYDKEAQEGIDSETELSHNERETTHSPGQSVSAKASANVPQDDISAAGEETLKKQDNASQAAEPSGTSGGDASYDDSPETATSSSAKPETSSQTPEATEKALSSATAEAAADTAVSAVQQEAGKTSENQTVMSCTISVDCNTVLSNMKLLRENKKEIIPESGYILAPTEISFENGETVFNVLRRITKIEKIQFEFSTTPATGSAYVEGIGNLYEMDCGALSGWTYSVNGLFPSVSISECVLQGGDIVNLYYTCDLGKDAGSAVAAE